MPGEGGGQQAHPAPMGLQHNPPMQQQQQVNGNYYHHGNVNGAPPPGHMGGVPPGQGGYGMYPAPPGPGSVGGTHTPSTHMTDLVTSPAGSQSSQMNFTGMMSPAGVGNAQNTGFVGDVGGGMHNMGRPHDLPIHNAQSYDNHLGYHGGDQSHMYDNTDVPVGEQIDYRQPPFNTVGGEDLVCGQGRPRDITILLEFNYF